MADASLQNVIDKISEAHGQNNTHFQEVKQGQDEQIDSLNKTVKVLQKIFTLQDQIRQEASEAAREAARISDGDDDGGDIPDGAKEEKRAGGFFSRMGKAIMNPVGAMGRGMKSMGKGIQGFLTGLANGLAAFANPMVLIGVTTLSISLPIFAAGLAAAFKVFDMIMGKGEAMKMVTGIIESLGKALGTVLKDILTGIGIMVQKMGPLITLFFKGLAIVIKALHPVIVDIFKIIKDIITDPVFNKTIQKVLDVIGIALKEISAIVQKVGDIIIAVLENIGGIIESVGNAIQGIFNAIGATIETVLNAIGDNVEKIGGTIEGIIGKIGTTIETVLNAIGTNIEKVGNTIKGIIGQIGDTVTQIIDGIVGGIERLAALDAGNMGKVALALAGLAGALVLFGGTAMIAGAVMPSPEEFNGIANSIKLFGDIDATNLVGVGDGIKAVGLGLMAFAAGELMQLLVPENSSGLERVASSVQKFGKIDATGFSQIGDGIKKLGIGIAFFAGGEGVGAVMDFFTSWAKDEDSDPIEKFKKFAQIGPGLSQAGMGVTALANSFDAFDEEKLQKIGVGLNTFLQSTDMTKLKAFSSATEGLVSGQMLAQLQVQANQAAATGRPLIIQSSTNTSVNNNSSAVLAGEQIKTTNGDNTAGLSG